MADRWKALGPEEVSEWMNFEAKDANWHYQPGSVPSLASLQAQGVAYLWNLLAKHRLALLADEVGMGKTFQALGVAALLWRMKPDAKVLIMAPNRIICRQWKKEFASFTRDHYRKADGCVKSFSDGSPVPPIMAQYRLEELANAIEGRSNQEKPAQLYITSIHALSGLTADVGPTENRRAAAKEKAQKIRRQILRALGDDGFDLVIIDEAHYFRNKNGSSQRVAAAKAFFGKPDNPIGQRTLMLTATPSHTHLHDVANILSYFAEIDENGPTASVEELMTKYGLRRFRIMAGNGGNYTKHQYRSEAVIPCGFVGRPEAEMFFALYQRKLIYDLKVREEKKRVLYGFLEGFESAGTQLQNSANSGEDPAHSHDDRSKDFYGAPDTALLRKMSEDYRKIFDCAPEHPKYGAVVEQCEPEALFSMPAGRMLHEDKHLVFVRRIPSVRELTKRLNESYDELFARELCAAWGVEVEGVKFRHWKSQKWSREGFNELTNVVGHEDPETEEIGSTDEPDDDVDGEHSYLRSKIADLFVTKNAKTGSNNIPPTDCSRFRLSMRKSTSIHAMFMEPASDYMAGGYDTHYEFDQGGKFRRDYTKAAQVKRMSAYDTFQHKGEDVVPPTGAVERKYDKRIKTLWSLVFSHLDPHLQAILCRWSNKNPDIAENFGNYLKAGLLFASPVIIELYCWHTRFQQGFPAGAQHMNAEKRYHDFVDYAETRISQSLLLKYFAASLVSFKQLCDKIIDHEANDYDNGWRTLTTLSSPAWYASGESSHRQHLILGFNSPFYPNTLVTTSVFQEGVNLHLQCRKVHHYGIAWTPGDNEQRVGRVDRLFGKVNDLLEEQEPGTVRLEINYPYLKGSFDEDQVGSFIERKYGVEEKMDRCTQDSFDKNVHMTRSNWLDFLRKPKEGLLLRDPYPAHFPDD